jgi:hypothetical protein
MLRATLSHRKKVKRSAMAHDHEAVMKREAIAYWAADRVNRPVKVTAIVRNPMFWTEGFVTCYKFVAGRTLGEAERILGLPSGQLAAGAYFYEFMRLPTAAEFELKGYSQCPDGKVWSPESEYPPGLGAAQWRVQRNTYIASRLAAIVEPGGKFP